MSVLKTHLVLHEVGVVVQRKSKDSPSTSGLLPVAPLTGSVQVATQPIINQVNSSDIYCRRSTVILVEGNDED